MRYSKRPRPSLLRTKFDSQQNSSNTPRPGQIQLLKTHIDEEVRKTADLRTTLKHLLGLIEQQTIHQSHLKEQMIDLSTQTPVAKQSIFMDPMIFISRKIPSDVKEFIIKSQNTLLRIQEQTKQHLIQSQPEVSSMSQKIKKIQEEQQAYGEQMLKIASQRLSMSCNKTVKRIQLDEVQVQTDILQRELRDLEEKIKAAQLELEGWNNIEQQLNKQTQQLTVDIRRYNEEIDILEEGAANQNECARRMIQMELLVGQEQQLLDETDKENNKRRMLTQSLIKKSSCR